MAAKAAEFSPDFQALAATEERLLEARLEATRSVISHAGEKGRALESALVALLRSFLPGEYGLSTGFVAYLDGNTVRLSSQLDIIIYDALRCGPLARFESCDVFPLEAVYGYVEVKASLTSTSDDAKTKAANSIEACLEQNAILRKMRTRTYFSTVSGSVAGAVKSTHNWLAIRGYVVAYTTAGTVASEPQSLAQRIADYTSHLGDAHLHGLLIPGNGFYWTRASEANTPKSEQNHVHYTTHSPLSVFKADMLHGLARFDRYPVNMTPALEVYGKPPQWQSAKPDPNVNHD